MRLVIARTERRLLEGARQRVGEVVVPVPDATTRARVDLLCESRIVAVQLLRVYAYNWACKLIAHHRGSAWAAGLRPGPWCNVKVGRDALQKPMVDKLHSNLSVGNGGLPYFSCIR